MVLIDRPAWELQLIRALEEAESYFMGSSRIARAAHDIAERLDSAKIPYAIAGAVALGAYGYVRTTSDIDVLLTRDGLAKFKELYLGRGYVEKFPGSKGLRDAVNNVAVDVLIAGDFPGDGKEKPVAFPDPAQVAAQGAEYRVLPLAKLIELKLASGMTAPHRMKDLADVIELVRAAGLPLELVEQLHPWVRDKFTELWNAAQGADPE